MLNIANYQIKMLNIANYQISTNQNHSDIITSHLSEWLSKRPQINIDEDVEKRELLYTGYISEENENTNLKRYMHPKVHSSITYNSQDVEAT